MVYNSLPSPLVLSFCCTFKEPVLVGSGRDTPYSRSVIAFFSRCPVGEGTTEYTKLRFPEQG